MLYCKHCIHFDVCKHHGNTVDFAVDDGVCLYFAKDTDVLTNADRIRAMSDEELAVGIKKIFIGKSPWCDHHCKLDDENSCSGCLLEWLKQPAEEGAENG